MIPIWFWPAMFLFTASVEVYIFYDLLSHRVPQKELGTKRRLLVLCLLVLIFFCINLLHIQYANAFVQPLVYLVAGILLSRSESSSGRPWHDGRLKSVLVVVLHFYMVGACVEAVFEAIYRVNDLQSSFTSDIGNALPYFVIIVFEKVVTLVIIKLFNRYWSVGPVNMPIGQFLGYLTLPFSTFAVMGLMLATSYGKELDTQERVWIVVGCVGLLISNTLIFYLFDKAADAAEQNRLLSMDKLRGEYTARELERLGQQSEKNSSFIHDIKDYIDTLYYLVDNKNYDKCKNVLQSMAGRLLEAKQRVYCDNVILNAVLAVKESDAERCGVGFEVDISKLADLSYIDDGDICVLLSNLLNNAIEAAQLCESDRFVEFHAYPIGTGAAAVIEVVNSYNGKLQIENGKLITNKKDRDRHGFGLSNVNDVVRKYEGDYFYEANNDEGIFITRLMLNSSQVVAAFV